jgi:hypothetical protein
VTIRDRVMCLHDGQNAGILRKQLHERAAGLVLVFAQLALGHTQWAGPLCSSFTLQDGGRC